MLYNYYINVRNCIKINTKFPIKFGLKFQQGEEKKMSLIYYKSAPSEVLLDNTITKQFQRMLLPLNIIQYAYFDPKFRIKDDFIMSNSRFEIAFTVVGNLILILIFFCRIFEVVDVKTTYVIAASLDFVVRVIGYVIKIFVNIQQSSNSVLLILKIQSIHIKQNSKAYSYKNMMISNWIYIIIIYIVFVICSIVYALKVDLHLTEIENIIIFLFLDFDVSVIYAFRIITCIRKELVLWTTEVIYYSSKNGNENFDYWMKMYTIYLDILDAFNTYKKVFQTTVSIFCFFLVQMLLAHWNFTASAILRRQSVTPILKKIF